MRTVEWHNKHIRLLDQRQLPWQTNYIELNDYRAVSQAIAEGLVHPRAAGSTAAYGMALAAQQSPALDLGSVIEFIEVAAVIFNKAQPGLNSVTQVVDRMMQVAHDEIYGTATEVRQAMIDEAQRTVDEAVAVYQKIGKLGSDLIRNGDVVLHHDNSGMLATLDYGTALGVIRTAFEQQKKFLVLLTESRPQMEGVRLAAWELDQLGVPFEIIPDAAAGYCMKRGEVNLVLVGAERIAANGDLFGRIGTYPLGVLAKEAHVPFYAVASLAQVDFKLTKITDHRAEQMAPEAMRRVNQNTLIPENFAVRVPAYDVTLQRYLAGIITEGGIVLPPFRENLPKAVRP